MTVSASYTGGGEFFDLAFHPLHEILLTLLVCGPEHRTIELLIFVNHEPLPGIEPGTYRLQGGCAASCAIAA